VALGANRQIVVMGRQEHRAVRSGLYPAEAGLLPRADHHTQVDAERLHGPLGQGVGSFSLADGADRKRGSQNNRTHEAP